MMSAIEAVPFSEADRRHSEEVLRNLARGADVAKVSTRDIRALPHARTMALAPALRSRRTALAVATAAALLVGATVLTFARRGSPPPAAATDSVDVVPAARDSVAPPPQRQPPAPRVATGTLRILTTPPDAVILIDGQRAGVGSVIDKAVPVGSRRIQARAPGYASYDTIVDVAAGTLVNLRRVTLRAAHDGP